jgi:hypothetical protein
MDGRSQVRLTVALVVRTATWLRDEEAAGSNPATPTTKLQVTGIFCDGFRLPISTVSRFWERPGADPAQPTSLTSGNTPLS